MRIILEFLDNKEYLELVKEVAIKTKMVVVILQLLKLMGIYILMGEISLFKAVLPATAWHHIWEEGPQQLVNVDI